MSGTRDSTTQLARTITPNRSPDTNWLKDGELYIEQADPMRLWVGVPTVLDATGRRLLFQGGVNFPVIFIGDAPPTLSEPGNLWFDSAGMQLMIRYDDGSSVQWVIANSLVIPSDQTIDGGYY